MVLHFIVSVYFPAQFWWATSHSKSSSMDTSWWLSCSWFSRLCYDVSVHLSVCDGSALRSRCMPGRGEGSSSAMLATARPSCLLSLPVNYGSVHFDTVWHSTLLYNCMAAFHLPTPVYNWLDFSVAIRTIPCSLVMSRRQEPSRQVSYRVPLSDQPHRPTVTANDLRPL